VLVRQLNDQPGESTVLSNLGVEYDEIGQFAHAIESYQQVLAIARATQDPATEGLVLNNLGKALFHAGKLPESEAALRRQAMLTTLKKYPQPREWAAFTLVWAAE
jgi:tetratricopeptide (TPR) repeat protein